jgi:hypothetical protein
VNPIPEPAKILSGRKKFSSTDFRHSKSKGGSL